jgi:colanic acid/amylovoran biosynthesis glycosyltransferase
MEAMASGMLVVSTRHSGIPELIDDGQSGVLVGERDCPALVAALRRLIAAPAVWPTMSRAARQKILDEFAIGSLNRALVDRFTALLADRREDAAQSHNDVAAAQRVAAPQRFVGQAAGAPRTAS